MDCIIGSLIFPSFLKGVLVFGYLEQDSLVIVSTTEQQLYVSYLTSICPPPATFPSAILFPQSSRPTEMMKSVLSVCCVYFYLAILCSLLSSSALLGGWMMVDGEIVRRNLESVTIISTSEREQ